ncbi:hypothetical protein BJV82DRAFT_574832 [Fennellomyces sp. T-0311]|nr:hypothetical protein BJV82DRAFT_574832 [Fennellomyces sp. T-0311]
MSSFEKEKSNLKKETQSSKNEKPGSANKRSVDGSKPTEKKPKSRKKDKVTDTEGSSSEVTQIAHVNGKSKKKSRASDPESSRNEVSRDVAVDERNAVVEKPKRSEKKSKVSDIENSSNEISRTVAVDESKANEETPIKSKKKGKLTVTDNSSSERKTRTSMKVGQVTYMKARSDKTAQDMPAFTRGSRKKDTKKEKPKKSKKNASDLLDEWHPAVHPKLSNIGFPLYFVNKHGDLFSNVSGELMLLEPLENVTPVSYKLIIRDGVEDTDIFKLEEIMMYTFSAEQLDRIEYYIFHKDGDQKNCAWNNLVICDDLSTLQRLEIARLEELHIGKKYTVIRNIHDTLTFERYLVSDKGDVYALIGQQHLDLHRDSHGEEMVYLYPDTATEQSTNNRTSVSIYTIIAQSFDESSTNSRAIAHNKAGNFQQNLESTAPSESIDLSSEPTRDVRRVEMKKSVDVPENKHVLPLPAATETRRVTMKKKLKELNDAPEEEPVQPLSPATETTRIVAERKLEKSEDVPEEVHVRSVPPATKATKEVTKKKLKELTVAREEEPVPALSPVTEGTNEATDASDSSDERFVPDTVPIIWRSVGTLKWNGRSYSKYEVSNKGSVRMKGSTEPLIARNLAVTLYEDGKPSKFQSRVTISRLVANAFVEGYSEKKKYVIHLNGDMHDCRAENLVWAHAPLHLQQRLRPVQVFLENDPNKHIEFPSIADAERGLFLRNKISSLKKKHGDTFTVEILWERQHQLARITVLPARNMT